ncbi:MAG: AzlC family ABC transporter permease [Bdellovibrionales bacterium]|nr:AzlC family ABC transporter permease [Bdellovibrionales bacterium]
MLPITAGIIPFGAVMGSVAADAKISFFNSAAMNLLVFAGAAQLAAVDLMTKNSSSMVVIATALVINLRFLLYSAALSPVVQKSSFLTKLTCSYFLTDQSYAAMSANEDQFRSSAEAIRFYLGSCICTATAWHVSVSAGYAFGNFAPASWSLDYAVPLSFLALVVPTLKNRRYVVVAVFSAITSVLLNGMPSRTGLIVTALLAIGLAAVLTRKSGRHA